jgi:hypothetical protein
VSGDLLGLEQHRYLSTACLHGVHGECGRLQHDRGELGVPHCKYCQASCLCPQCRHGGDDRTGLPAGRAFYSDYQFQHRVRRLHIIRDTPGRVAQVGSTGWCGTPAWDTAKSGHRVIIDPMPAVPPDGFTWCASCVGHFAELAGQLGLFAALLAGPGR